MREKLLVPSLILLLGALAMGGCRSSANQEIVEQPTDTPADKPVGMPNPASAFCEEQGYTLEIRTDAGGNQYGVCILPDGECEEWAFFRGECGAGQEADQPAPYDRVSAREAALRYIQEQPGQQAPGPGLSWTEKETTPEGVVGASTVQYTAGDWVMTLSHPVVAPEQVVYQVTLANATTGFEWQGEVDAAGQVTEISLTPTGQSVAGWLGYVASTPSMAQFDDYLVLSPQGAGEIGLSGADDDLEAQIEALRDKPEPGKYAHFWGTLTCDVPDYGGCQLLVTRLRAGPTVTAAEQVEGWEGTLVSNPPEMQFDDYFLLAGDFAVGYGIHSLNPEIQRQIESLRDTGTPFRVWGQLRCGVPDAYGSQIQVEQIEIVGQN